MSRGTRAVINRSALQHNLNRVREAAPAAKVWAVVKANAYGHGANRVADALAGADGFAVSTLDEALSLRSHGVRHPILLLSGVTQTEHWAQAAQLNLHCVIHCRAQVEQLAAVQLSEPLNVWLKVDTGMHRLGLLPENFQPVLEKLSSTPNVSIVGALTHMAAADVSALDATTQQQFADFQSVLPSSMTCSIGNSATILRHPDFHGDWVRPGIMLYGASPTDETPAADFNLKPVMTFEAPVIAVREIAPGESVGYGCRWQAQRPSQIATLAVGYGDGYPRHAPDGTPIWLGGRRVPLAGRVSMDLVTVDVTECGNIQVGDVAQLWGDQLPVDDVARSVGTIGYELLTRISSRVPAVIS